MLSKKLSKELKQEILKHRSTQEEIGSSMTSHDKFLCCEDVVFQKVVYNLGCYLIQANQKHGCIKTATL